MSNDGKPSMALFWGCFIALITTSYAFFSRMYLCDVRFGLDFGIDKVTIGALKGAGIWPFAISIILFSLIIDRIGYKIAMLFSFVCYLIYAGMAFMAYGAIQGVTGDALVAAQARGYNLLYWGSVILGLGNGTVEAFINPVVATMFSKDKTKWLNILHAGWPGGLVFGGLCTIALAGVAASGDWRIVLGLVLVPAVIYLVMLIGAKFPVNEREQAGVSYVQMLGEFGVFGALVAFGLIFAQLEQVPELSSVFFAPYAKWIYTGVVAALFGLVTKSFGRPLLAFMIVIMGPLATTEIGTDGWINSLMEEPMKAAGANPGWVLIYTSAIMMVLRFFAGPIVHKLSPIGLLITSSVLAIAGLLALSKTGSSGLLIIFAAATLYGFGKTFFWPTMLGITAEQSPKGGALTLNAISGIGMLAVGILGFPFIGSLQEDTTTKLIQEKNSALVEQITVDKKYVLGAYKGVDPVKAAAVTAEEDKSMIAEATKAGQFTALGRMAMFPAFMLVCYMLMFLYFKSKGGYKAVDLMAPDKEGGQMEQA
ncbi:MAG TPA: MFS transporter [Verrucomicrobiales bacterium]|nr:MFS transporter [Verrucomicrobiales bacterium]HRJ09107.1 MFS transporter [Prosthecobacter sp.]HRK15340.1 MFS transporter [Prosthecobacter sp.]